jgi:hypothetical protein
MEEGPAAAKKGDDDARQRSTQSMVRKKGGPRTSQARQQEGERPVEPRRRGVPGVVVHVTRRERERPRWKESKTAPLASPVAENPLDFMGQNEESIEMG